MLTTIDGNNDKINDSLDNAKLCNIVMGATIDQYGG